MLGINNSIFQHLGIRSNVSNNTRNLWKRVQKSSLDENQDNIDENEEQDQYCFGFLSQKTDAVSGILKPVIANIILLNGTPDMFTIRPLTPNADCKTVCNYIHYLLSLNNL